MSKSRDSSSPTHRGAHVRLVTELGDIVVLARVDRAPLSAGDFLRYVDRGLYEAATFYRTVRADNDRGEPPIEAIQGGLTDPAKLLERVPHESTRTTGLRHLNGTLSLARTALGSACAGAFFICIGAQPALDFGGMRNPDGQGFAAFGRVVDGMDLVREIHGRPTRDDSPHEYTRGQLLADPVKILQAVRVDWPS